ncbi:17.1 kDa class II heat shock protein-like [Durio zibethinus]|uniref:17.1 kDa class II heat shock protein-like n=1 Tax=Durio zibethinus TaxID=66656 RepID=A0A6P5ZV48_DURZI|nr:17.1 kDa class II heat shock protein-like [Durio zibethinus]
MDLRVVGFDPSIIETLHELLDFPDEAEKTQPHPSRTYIRDAKAMAATPADVKDCPNAYVVVIDMPGLKQDQVKVQVEERNLLVVSGERKRENEKDQGVKYIKMERRLGQYLKKFQLPENADAEKISASYQDGSLTVAVERKPPPEPKQPRTVEVQVS